MPVNSVSNTNLGQRVNIRKQMEKFANFNDRELLKMASQDAAMTVDYNKAKRTQSLLYWAMPLAIGLSLTLGRPAKAAAQAVENIPTKQLTKGMQTFTTFLKKAGLWVGAFAASDAIMRGEAYIVKDNDSVKRFGNKHPLATISAIVGTGLAGMFAFYKFAPKVVSKVAKLLPEKFIQNTTEKLFKLDNKLATSKIGQNLAKGWGKVPSAIKSFVKGSAILSPLLVFGAKTANSISYNKKRNAVVQDSYERLKVAQNQVRDLLNYSEDIPETVEV